MMTTTLPMTLPTWDNTRRYPCADCGGTESVAIRSDGLQHCHRCDTTTPPTDGDRPDYRQTRQTRRTMPVGPTIAHATPWVMIDEYTYHNEGGALLYTVERLHRDETTDDGQTRRAKRFRQYHRDDTGRRVDHMTGVRRVLWQLPAVLLTICSGGTVWLCEGEKAAAAVDAELLQATTTVVPDRATTAPGGATAWRQSAHVAGYVESLRGARVILWQDDDAAGDTWLADVTRALDGVATIETTLRTRRDHE